MNNIIRAANTGSVLLRLAVSGWFIYFIAEMYGRVAANVAAAAPLVGKVPGLKPATPWTIPSLLTPVILFFAVYLMFAWLFPVRRARHLAPLFPFVIVVVIPFLFQLMAALDD